MATLSTITLTLIRLLVIRALAILLGEAGVLAGVRRSLSRCLLISSSHIHALHAAVLFGVVPVALEGGSSGDAAVVAVTVTVAVTMAMRSGGRHHHVCRHHRRRHHRRGHHR